MIRVVLVDDHPSVRDGVRRSLSAEPDIDVVGEAGDGDAALLVVAELSPDVVVLDMDMPGRYTGADVARRVAKTSRVLAFSAHQSPGFIRAMMDAGASGYVTKDKPSAELVAAVRAVARGEGRWLVDVADLSDPTAILTPRERDVLTLLAGGRTNKVIAATLFLSVSTVRNALTSVYGKLGVDNARAAVAWAWEHGLVTRR